MPGGGQQRQKLKSGKKSSLTDLTDILPFAEVDQRGQVIAAGEKTKSVKYIAAHSATVLYLLSDSGALLVPDGGAQIEEEAQMASQVAGAGQGIEEQLAGQGSPCWAGGHQQA